MSDPVKSARPQIHVYRAEEVASHHAARQSRFAELIDACRDPETGRFAIAELHDWLGGLRGAELRDAITSPPASALTPYLANYIAAMVEYACAQRSIAPPPWTQSIAPLTEPVFGSTLTSLRLHLLTHSPPPFRRRNIFIDSSIGARV